MFRRNKVKPITDIIVTDREILHYMLKTPNYKEILLQESYKTFTSENILFLIEINKLSGLKSKKEINAQIQLIYETFIANEILNIQSNELQSIRSNLEKTFNTNIYNKAYNNIFLLVINNDIARIKKHSIFPQLIAEIHTQKKKRIKSKWNLLKYMMKSKTHHKMHFRNKQLSLISEEI